MVPLVLVAQVFFKTSSLFLVFFFVFSLLPLVRGILWNIKSGPTSVGSLSFVKFQVVFKFVSIFKLYGDLSYFVVELYCEFKC